MDAETDADATIEDDRFVDMPEADLEFLRQAAANLRGEWIVTATRTAQPDEDGAIVTYAEIEPAHGNIQVDTAFEVLKMDDETYKTRAFAHPLQGKVEDQRAHDLGCFLTIAEAFHAAACLILDPVALPDASTTVIYGSRRNDSDERDGCGITTLGEASAADECTLVALTDQTQTSARRVAEGWQGFIGAAGAIVRPTIQGAIAAAWDAERARRRQKAA
jgi:hypothetical protein